jgi:LPXTG-motif cell wall-anchored protein
MKRLKRIMALVIAMAMVLTSFSTMAFAANTAKTLDPFVEVTGLDEGDVVKFYKVIEWDQSSGWKFTTAFSGLSESGKVDGTVVGWNSEKGDTDDIKSDVLKYIAGIAGDATVTYDDDGNPTVDYNEATKGRINSELAAKIAALAAGTPADEETVAEEATSVKWQKVEAQEASGDTPAVEGKNAPEAGLYIALVTPKTAGVMYNPIFVSADYDSTNAAGYANTQSAVLDPRVSYSDEAMAKKTKIDVKKTIEEDEVKVTVGEDENTTAGSTAHLSSGGDTEGNTATSVDAGEVLKFKVATTIPEYNNMYTSAAFEISDTLTGLALKMDADHPFEVKVKIGDVWETISNSNGLGKAKTEASPEYTNSAANEGGNYAIAFSSSYILGLSAATPVEITYYATITDDAAEVINPTDNTVTVQFSNNPNNIEDKGTLKDRTNQYSFSIDANINGKDGKTSSELIKIGVDKDGNPLTEKKSYDNGLTEIPALQGATFVLLTDQTNINSLIGKSKSDLEAYDGAGADDIYSNTVNGTVKKAIVDSSDVGKLTFNGLDKGTYYLVETKAPDGFIRDTTVYTITIDPTYESETIKETIGDREVTYTAQTLAKYKVTITGGDNTVESEYVPVKGENNSAGSMTFTNITNRIEGDEDNNENADHSTLLKNTQGTELPSTGGIGTTIFYVVGAILVIGAGVILITRRRMDA